MIRLDKDDMRWELLPDTQPLLEKILASEGHVVKQSPVKLVTRHRVDAKTYYVKRYRHAAVPLRPLKFLFKPSQARQEWLLAQRLTALDVPIVEHVALGERWSICGLRGEKNFFPPRGGKKDTTATTITEVAA